MTWANKAKIETEGTDLEIHTPDGEQILVGSAEDQVLLYQEEFSDWDNKAKIAGEWSNKAKISA